MTAGPDHVTSAGGEGAAPNGWSWSLLRGFREGDRAAMKTVYRMYAADVAKHLRYGFSFESLGRAHRFAGYRSSFELHDALNETFRRAFEPKTRQGYDGLRPFGPYLRAIARNVVLRSFRAREVLFPSTAAGDDHVSTIQDSAESPEQSVATEQIRRLVATFVAGLPADQRRLLEVRFVEGKSQRDAADILGLGRQQIRSREAKLRRKLLAFLRERGETRLAGQAVSCLSLFGAANVLGEVFR